MKLAYLISLFLVTAAALSGNAFSTSFPNAEIPVSGGGIWINGKTTGVEWSDVLTNPGFAYGAETGSVNFDDSTAVLAGVWGPDQIAQATVFNLNPPTWSQSHPLFEEVEVRLLTTITAGWITGYEVNCSVVSGNSYVQIIRWNGALGDFTELNGIGVGKGCATGDVLKASVKNGVITAFVNDQMILQVSDSTYINGAPGIGFYINGSGGTGSNFGFSSFSATDGLTAIGTPEPSPRILLLSALLILAGIVTKKKRRASRGTLPTASL